MSALTGPDIFRNTAHNTLLTVIRAACEISKRARKPKPREVCVL